jgi:glutamate carboxypeptidase
MSMPIPAVRLAAAAAAAACLSLAWSQTPPAATAPAPAVAASPAAAMPRPADAALLAAATAEQPQVMRTLERLVNIETGTGDAEGMTAMGQLLETELKALGATVTRHQATAGVVGQNIVGRIAGRGGKRLLLMAHMDTVYERGTLAKAPFRVQDNRAYGPGIADDKAGIAVILHRLKLLKARGFQDFGQLTVMFNTDEEKGSFGSRDLIQQLAAEADYVLSVGGIGAAAGAFGDDVGHRARLGDRPVEAHEARIKGLASHAGAAPEAGISNQAEYVLINVIPRRLYLASRMIMDLGQGR